MNIVACHFAFLRNAAAVTHEARARIYKAIGHPARLAMLDAMADGECCVCELVEVAGLSWATVSRHLSVLREAGLIEGRKEGAWIHYRLLPQPPDAAPPWLVSPKKTRRGMTRIACE